MAASGAIKDYLGFGVIASRPSSLTLATGVAGYWYATDTGILSVWNGSAWTNVSTGGSSLNVQQAGSTIVTGATVLNFASGATVAASGTTANVTVSGGGSGWTTLNHWSFASSGAVTSVDTTSISASSVMIVGSNVTVSSASVPLVLLSDSNGTTYYNTSGNYSYISTAGAGTNVNGFTLTASTATTAKSWFGKMDGLQTAGMQKPLTQTTDGRLALFTASTSAINAIRVIPSAGSGATWTGGDIWILGR